MDSNLAKIDMIRYLAGPVVQILVGADKKALYVHTEALLSCDSPSLRTLVGGNWLESRDNVINWTEHDMETVERFLTFLYVGDYTAPEPEKIVSENAPKEQGPSFKESNLSVNSFGFGTVSVVDDFASETELQQDKTILESFSPRPLTPISRCLDAGLPLEHLQTDAGRFEEQSPSFSDHSYVQVLLVHAQVYTFARYHIVTQLQKFALQRLTQTLRCIDCEQTHAVSDVTPLLRYVYSNTVQQESVEEPVRKLVSQFAAIHFTDLMKGEFESLFAEGGDFTLDVARKVSRRLVVSGGSSENLEQQIDGLENEVRDLKKSAEIRTNEIQRLRHDVAEWKDLRLGTSKKIKKKSHY